MTSFHLDDTIVALSSAPGAGVRAIVRLSGPQACALVSSLLVSGAPLPRGQHHRQEELRLPTLDAPLPVEVHVWVSPRSYTGQDMVELHTPGSPPLVDLLIATLLDQGARAAGPGEFTLRAFLAGKLDLTRAEAVLGVIDAGSRAELRQALGQLAGGVARPLQELRDDLLNLLADVEAGLDFSEEDITFVQQEDLLHRLSKGLALITLVGKQVDQRGMGERPFRVALAGRPNAGKSSLFNALGGKSSALVSPEPGTTRDYLLQRLEVEGGALELIDTAGWQAVNGTIEEQAQQLGREQTREADLVLLCIDANHAPTPEEEAFLTQKDPPVVHVATKSDQAPVLPGVLATSASTGTGLDDLKRWLGERVRRHRRPALAPSLSRCRHHVARCLDHLRRAHRAVLEEDPAEIVALEVRGALTQLGEMVGAVYTDDLLDRIFSRFCIGK